MADVSQSYRIEHQGKIAIVTALEMDEMLGHTVHEASAAVIDDLKKQPPAGLIVDLSRVKLFRSNFLAFLLRLHTMSKRLGTEMALAETQPAGIDLLKLTNLDKLWVNYPTRDEALKAVAKRVK
jgi:anti-anti-sigma factor